MQVGWLWAACLASSVMFGAGAARVAAQTAETQCAPGQSPQFVLGFADMQAMLGETMGQPTTCEFPDPNGTGDVHQQTSTGLAFWRKSTNTPTFTNGAEHWANTPTGWVYWTGTSIDPVADAQPWPLQSQAPVAPTLVPPSTASRAGVPATPVRPTVTPTVMPTAAPPTPTPTRVAPTPTPVAVTPLPSTAAGSGRDQYNCSDFSSQAQAQSVLRADPTDPNRLDTDRDGIACESNRAPYDRQAVPRR